MRQLLLLCLSRAFSTIEEPHHSFPYNQLIPKTTTLHSIIQKQQKSKNYSKTLSPFFQLRKIRKTLFPFLLWPLTRDEGFSTFFLFLVLHSKSTIFIQTFSESLEWLKPRGITRNNSEIEVFPR